LDKLCEYTLQFANTESGKNLNSLSTFMFLHYEISAFTTCACMNVFSYRCCCIKLRQLLWFKFHRYI